jgi:predicted transcriptional regulator of viral defense system
MPETSNTNFEKLFEIADSQGGLFTSQQAEEAGFSRRMQTYHVQTGDWKREWRGVYRLNFYPQQLSTDLMVWYLWSCNREGKPQGVYSYDTALELHNLSNWTSNRLHMTVPSGFKRRVIPKSLRLHTQDLRHFEITTVTKVQATTPVRTILDLLKAKTIPHHHLMEAWQEARSRGLIVASDLKSAFWSTDERNLLQKLDAESQSYRAAT